MFRATWHTHVSGRGGQGLAPESPTVNEGASTSGSLSGGCSGGSSGGSRIKLAR